MRKFFIEELELLPEDLTLLNSPEIDAVIKKMAAEGSNAGISIIENLCTMMTTFAPQIIEVSNDERLLFWVMNYTLSNMIAALIKGFSGAIGVNQDSQERILKLICDGVMAAIMMLQIKESRATKQNMH